MNKHSEKLQLFKRAFHGEQARFQTEKPVDFRVYLNN